MFGPVTCKTCDALREFIEIMRRDIDYLREQLKEKDQKIVDLTTIIMKAGGIIKEARPELAAITPQPINQATDWRKTKTELESKSALDKATKDTYSFWKKKKEDLDGKRRHERQPTELGDVKVEETGTDVDTGTDTS